MSDPSRLPPKVLEELVAWLNTKGFTHFVTLATNDPDLRSADRRVIGDLRGVDRMDALVRRWDARMNRALVGPKWAKPLYEMDRMFAFYFLEKASTNPHWHALIRIDDDDPDRRATKLKKLHELTEENWLSIISSGSTDVKRIYDQEDVVNYVAKELGRPVSYEHFIPADVFSTFER